jgi:hypothetical protein
MGGGDQLPEMEGSQSPSGSLRAYARHRGCSHQAVRKAIATGRLDRSVGRVDGKPRICFGLADEEWSANTGRLHRHRQAGQGFSASELDALKEPLAVFVTHGLVVLGWGPEREPICVPFAPSATRQFTRILLRAADRAEADQDDCAS